MRDIHSIIFNYIADDYDEIVKYKDIIPNWKNYVIELDLYKKLLQFPYPLSDFPNLIKLNISSNNLYELPLLPEKIEWLDCSANNLTSILILPLQIEWLDCSINKITYMRVLSKKNKIIRILYNPIRLENIEYIKDIPIKIYHN